MLVKCQQATASDLPFYDIFAPQKVSFLKISDDVIVCDLWFAPPQSKILATSMTRVGLNLNPLTNYSIDEFEFSFSKVKVFECLQFKH